MSLLVNNISLDFPLAILLSSREGLPEMDVNREKGGCEDGGDRSGPAMPGPRRVPLVLSYVNSQ